MFFFRNKIVFNLCSLWCPPLVISECLLLWESSQCGAGSSLCSLTSLRRRVWWWPVQSDLPSCSRHRTVYVLVGQMSYWAVVVESSVCGKGRGWFSHGHWFCMCSRWAQRSLGWGVASYKIFAYLGKLSKMPPFPCQVLCNFYCLPKSMVRVLYYVWIIWFSCSKRILTNSSVPPCLTMFIQYSCKDCWEVMWPRWPGSAAGA